MKVLRNPAPELHPFEREREYTRALTAAKMDAMFAKPFIGQLEGHSDGVWSMSINRRSLTTFVSGACDGEVRVWDLSSRTTLWRAPAHAGFVRGVSVSASGDKFYSCGDDKTVKLWDMGGSHTHIRARPRAGRHAPRGAAGAAAKSARKRLSDYKVDSDGEDAEEEEDEDDRSRDSEDEYSDEDDHTEGEGAAGDSDNGRHSPLTTFRSSSLFHSVDCHWRDPSIFVTSGEEILLWDTARLEPTHSFSWGADTIQRVCFNPAEHALLASVASDRSITLYDARAQTAARKVILRMRSNSLAWNPREPFNFTVANEDSMLYTFDMRNLNEALMVHKDHVSAVMDVAYSPTGREFVSGSYDRSVRIFKSQQGRSREVYHTRRMQRVFCVEFTGDARFVLSGSDDTNIRIWKAERSKSLKKPAAAEKQKNDYNAALLKRYGHLPEVRRIKNHRHVPKTIFKTAKLTTVMRNAAREKEKRRRAHSKPGTHESTRERKRAIVKELE